MIAQETNFCYTDGICSFSASPTTKQGEMRDESRKMNKIMFIHLSSLIFCLSLPHQRPDTASEVSSKLEGSRHNKHTQPSMGHIMDPIPENSGYSHTYTRASRLLIRLQGREASCLSQFTVHTGQTSQSGTTTPFPLTSRVERSGVFLNALVGNLRFPLRGPTPSLN